MIVAAADGSSLSNPGPAGWAWYISDDIWAAGGWEHGTNNMGELMAVLDLLQSTAKSGEALKVLCDSQYVINSLTKWMPGWKRRGWKKGDGKPVLNVDLMKELDAALQGREVQFEWVKGHSGHAMNEAADVRARAAAEAFRDGRMPDAGPGFPDALPTARAQVFEPLASDPEPDLFSIPPPPEEPAAPRAAEPVPVTPGTASPRDKAAVLHLTRQLLSDDVRTDESRLLALLHPDFVGHSVDGRVVDAKYGPWQPTEQGFEVLGIDSYGAGLVGMRWLQGHGRDVLRFNLWQKVPSGWRLRFAQATRSQE